MTVTEEIIRTAADLEQFKQWRMWMPRLKPLGYAYVKGEARRYYLHKDTGHYFYRTVSEAEMHRIK